MEKNILLEKKRPGAPVLKRPPGLKNAFGVGRGHFYTLPWEGGVPPVEKILQKSRGMTSMPC